jgi:hypothetical protein
LHYPTAAYVVPSPSEDAQTRDSRRGGYWVRSIYVMTADVGKGELRCVPLSGVATLHSAPGIAFSEKQIAVRKLAAQAVIAIENTRCSTNCQRTDDLARL